MKHLLSTLDAAVLPGTVPAVSSAENMNLVLNRTPTADHSPIYYAKSKGWYFEAGIDLAIEAGKGSAVSAQRAGSGGADIGISHLPTSIQPRGKGASLASSRLRWRSRFAGLYRTDQALRKSPRRFSEFWLTPRGNARAGD